MRVRSVLVVCLGNICRSPLGAALLAREVPGLAVASAGLAAPPAAPADPEACRFAQSLGLDLGAHRSRMIDAGLMLGADLILVMDASLRDEMRRRWPHVSGKTFLFGHWIDARDVPDPIGLDPRVHRESYALLHSAALAWVARLKVLQ